MERSRGRGETREAESGETRVFSLGLGALGLGPIFDFCRLASCSLRVETVGSPEEIGPLQLGKVGLSSINPTHFTDFRKKILKKFRVIGYSFG